RSPAQGPSRDGAAQVAEQPVLRQVRDVRARGCLQPVARRGIHPTVLSPLADRGAQEGRSKRLMALWGGRFEGKADPLFRALNDSLRFDWRLVKHDIAGSIAWAWQLVGAGVLAMSDAEKLAAAL